MIKALYDLNEKLIQQKADYPRYRQSRSAVGSISRLYHMKVRIRSVLRGPLKLFHIRSQEHQVKQLISFVIRQIIF